MSPFSVQIMLAISEAEHAVRALPADADIEARLRAAMGVTRKHWFCTAEPERFKAAVAAVMQSYGQGSPEWERLGREHRLLSRFSHALEATQAGVDVGWGSVFGELAEAERPEPVGLLRLWNENEGATK